ncbi:uncharacterized protein OCT59_029381 [Rhizophagus irregularis]|uniref:F-box domain-containing protein n=3 Tax=Rhizophagus irregularis TaxID=588596 RepID=A0A015JDM6_RHIIW|nr:hypothetical protein GLOIN_2v1784962 [Rhizophagus irregularis DAOM 181602=DAOM 197198]EXX53059.1 hypothetical protein RirG_247600 [Rhizophagus irregularis DAOM 197198w]POG62704.1 hypothetical protein GLOIN_2v1784962 [Rhizophagus irregularis DAOM 181602=DAOM 197198]UZO09144.1 hypothetical protein OCT59_029381 [Rhizophagus irregularis]|eukprot:XP_025169570.1 hypothetical protein GLOIN_2v1784962 [Rhizophagus irregularis DAOM 181602=DAOM 197198]
MCKLNRDILYLIFKELQDDKKTLISCLTVNKIWCETTVPILWKNPWKFLKGKKLLLNVIISHLSDESRNSLSINYLINYQKPFFNYIRFCRHLNINNLNEIIDTIELDDVDDYSTIRKEIFGLFINENTRLTHLYIPYQFDYQINLISGAKHCFSDLEFLSCNACINDSVLSELTEICKSIKELELFIEKDNNNYGIIKLVESLKKLYNVRLLTKRSLNSDESFCRSLENSLIKHADTIQNFKIIKQPATSILSSLVNLNRLELGGNPVERMSWNCLKNVSLPFLQILKAKGIPIKALTNLIENTNGGLTEIKIDCVLHNDIDNEKIIQIIYRKCSNLKYLKLMFKNKNILELKKLLINCKNLNGLYIIIDNTTYWVDGDMVFNWDYLFEILVSSSSPNLFKFKFYFYEAPKLESLKLFLDNWKGRRSILLQTIQDNSWGLGLEIGMKYFELMEEYKMQGIVKKYNHVLNESTFEDFEWLQENI